MKYITFQIGIVILAACLFPCTVLLAQPFDGEQDRTLSPYFHVISDDAAADRLPLKSTIVEADISGVISDVRVTQVYENRGRIPLEAVYVFPASTRAAVYGMKMTIGERTVVAEIKARRAARQEYEQARREGRSATLLEQQRPNVFTMNVANILPGDVIFVELSYTELLVPMNAVYEFVYPTVVGPRYSNMSAADAQDNDQWVENPYLHQGEEPTYNFDIQVNLSAGLPIADISCDTHKTNITYEGRTFAAVGLDESELAGGNRDFICKYRLAGKAIETGLLLYEGSDENFFLMMVQPPERVRLERIPPREYIFIVDVSGSMNGFPLNVSKKLLRDLIGGLRSVDRFNVLLFAGGSTVLSQRSLPATKKNIEYVVNAIDRERGGGGTELLPALKRALALPGAEGCSRSIVIATDGYVSVEKEAFDLIRKNLGTANFFSFGIGSSVNRYLMEGMARAGTGEAFFVTEPEEAAPVAKRFRDLLESPVLTDIRVKFEGFEAYDVEPQSIPDVFAERPVIVYGKWRGERSGTIHIEGLAGKGFFFRDMDVLSAVSRLDNASLKYLWARNRIAVLSDYNRLGSDEKIIGEVTSLGLMYNLLTDYTSFVAVDSLVRNQAGNPAKITQPLPLPQGVSNYAVGAGRSFSKMSVQASPMLKVFKDKEVFDVAATEVKEEHDTMGSLVKGDKVSRIQIELKEVSVPADLNKDTVVKIIEGSLASMELCSAEANPREIEVAYTLVIDPVGRVKEVKTDKPSTAHQPLIECLMNRCKGLHFPSSRSGKDVVIKVFFFSELTQD